jgi:hypothetical protein
MTLIERYYSCGMVTVASTLAGYDTSTVPAISLEPMLSDGFARREVGGDESFLVAATAEAWATFDALYPDQDTQTGSPYRRRAPRSSLMFVDFGGEPA